MGAREGAGARVHGLVGLGNGKRDGKRTDSNHPL